MGEKELGYSCSIHHLGARGKNYPLTKAMVDHDHDRIEAIDWGEVGDEVHREILKGLRAFKGKGGDSWERRMGEDLLCLASCASGDIFPDIGGKAGPPVILWCEDDHHGCS